MERMRLPGESGKKKIRGPRPEAYGFLTLPGQGAERRSWEGGCQDGVKEPREGTFLRKLQLGQVLWIVSLSKCSFREVAGAEASEPSTEMDQVLSQELNLQRSTVT